MRFFDKSVILSLSAFVAITAGMLSDASAQQAQPAAAGAGKGHLIAVVDVAYIFKNHPLIKGEVATIENQLKEFDKQMAAKREELKAGVEKLKEYRVGTPEYRAQEESIAQLESKMRLEMSRTRQTLAEAEARIYYDNYKLISQGVAQIAKVNGVNLVLRYNSEEMDLDAGDSVIRGVMKAVIYHDPSMDMTPYVMQYLEQVKPQVARQGNGLNR